MSAESDRRVGLCALNEAYRYLTLERVRIADKKATACLSLAIENIVFISRQLKVVVPAKLPDTIVLGED